MKTDAHTQLGGRAPSGRTLGRVGLHGKTFLIPEMNRIASHLIAAGLRSFGVDAQVLETYRGLDHGKKYTSGKECYPCLVTLGDLLHFVEEHRTRLGDGFRAEDYVYFMPESDGPCRFGLYNKFQRLVLDSLPGLNRLAIGALTTTDSYSPDGFVEPENVTALKKTAYLSAVAADILERLTWRVRPYEKEPGRTDAFVDGALRCLTATIEKYGVRDPYEPVMAEMDAILREALDLIDPRIPPKPRIGIVGEIFLRMHPDSNQHLIRVLEKYGAEVVNASMAEWMKYVSYEGLRIAKRNLRLNLKLLRLPRAAAAARDVLNFGLTLLYQERTQKSAFRRAQGLLDLAGDHKISHLVDLLERSEVFSFDIPTEACLSIPSILHCARDGYHGVVNVYPFTCMPSTTASAVVRPLMNEWRFPYLDTPYDGSSQPGREAAIRTFMYQAHQHMERNGRKN
jgi:predicted nucleotide-binding protein (sugar kinase/HSP70/actin superfamily)